MPNETAINRLLYAILSQKCLKDIDWNKVANDPVLKKEITNGHAARMRYSRFKKQMEGTSGVSRKPRNPNSPRKNKPKKNTKPEKNATIPEYFDEENGRPELYENEEYAADGEMGMAGPRMIKRERETKLMLGAPFTPQSQNSTPSPGTNQHDFGFVGSDLGEMDPMDNMATSFGYVGDELYPTMMRQENYDNGMGIQMNEPSGYDEEMWQQQEMNDSEIRSEIRMVDEDGVPVKREQRWDVAYRHS
ncbi:hypothetical protein HYFRA_00000835 [Hymenoscyphus fraxineus]|uniref:Myb-like DNA-binding domain-containing protein n=1 Tax=Hymenoscyphus fraxineus TaxID=746836 RepID=A0A9N9KU74_9HELO|nr:hypothetical protein HYFRA_00000835 [Hymenoscyphus fraxineus]